MSARDCAMAILCSAGRLRPARLVRGGKGAAQAAERWGGMAVDADEEDEHDVLLVATVMSVAVGTDGDDDVVEVQLGIDNDCWWDTGGGGGGGKAGGGGRLEDNESVAVFEVSMDKDWAKAAAFLRSCERERFKDSPWGRVCEYEFDMDEAVAEYGIVPWPDLGPSTFVGGSLRPSVCDAMAFAFTLKTSMHCWQAHGCPGEERDEVESVPLG